MKQRACVAVVVLMGACGSSGEDKPATPKAAPAPETAPAVDDTPPALPPAEPPEPAKKPTEACVNMASDFMDVACSTAWECDDYAYDVGCKPKPGVGDVLVCTCNWDAEDRHTFEMPSADCRSLGLDTVNARCNLPVVLVLDED